MTPSTDKIELIRKLFGECPAHKNLTDCPARNIRKLTPENQARLLEQMSAANIKAILEHHNNCMLQ